MIPVAGSIIPTTPIQTPLINTALPGAAVVHVPYDNVAPSVSSGEVNNNARDNSGGILPAEEEAAAITEGNYAATRLPAGDAANIAPAGQATFIAQLLSQGTPISGVLLEYEKLISFSYVKYKPSNAAKPAPPPAGIFGRILQEEKAAPPRVQARTEAPPAAVEKVDIPAAPPAKDIAAAAPVTAASPPGPRAVSKAFDAYTASAARNDTIDAEAVTDLA